MEWLRVDDLVAINRWTVEATQEPHQLLSQGALESGLNRGRNLNAYEDVEDIAILAAEIVYGIAKAHAFLQGNKRTAFHGMTAFLELNGWMPAHEAVWPVEPSKLVIQLITGEIDVRRFADHIRPRLIRLPEPTGLS